ncbi:MAG: hypothetical protein ABII88_02695 [Candidatus Omnitrophota bacterium]
MKIKEKYTICMQWFKKNWKPVIPIVISIVAICYARSANITAKNNYELSKIIANLNLRPIIRLSTQLRDSGKMPAHFTITNIGPIDALQVKVEMYTHRFIPKTGKFPVSTRDSSHEHYVPKLEPQKPEAFKFSSHWLNVNSRVAIPPENNVIEIRITYRRPKDLKEFDESAFFFISPENNWVGENETIINTETYDKIKAALFKYVTKETIPIYDEWRGDLLHENN